MIRVTGFACLHATHGIAIHDYGQPVAHALPGCLHCGFAFPANRHTALGSPLKKHGVIHPGRCGDLEFHQSWA
jgi:hypothetical protein